MSENLPLVTVNILSFNRRDELRHTLTKVYEQDYKNIEVIVVDNASSDGSPEMVEKEFPNVILIKLDKNIGIAGWNKGFEIAKGEYVLVLDDDSYPDEKTIHCAIEVFNTDSQIAVVACSIFNTELNKFETESYNRDKEYRFIGCGAFLVTQTVKELGYFLDELFLYVHEIEFCMRVIDKNYKVVFTPKAKIIHNLNNINRKTIRNNIDTRKLYYSTKNILLILSLHFPLYLVLFRIIRIISGRIYYGLKTNTLIIIIKSVKTYLKEIYLLRDKRIILKPETRIIYSNGAFAGGFYFRIDDNINQKRKIQF